MLKLDIQMFARPKLVIETDLNTKKFESGLDKIKDTTQKAGSTVKNIVKALGISKMISVAMNEINNSIDGAISRFDTLNNFPKVMSNLGVGTEEADKSLKKLGDKLAGLPTTLDEAALSVQRLTSKNDDIEKSTDLFLALNNAILAGGAGAEIQSSALEQMSQAYSKGKMDMMEWRTIQMAMPAQLKQVAKAMGVTTDELGVMLREADDGGETMERFMETIVALNEQGIDGFQSFEEQARNSTGGIKTAITVAKTQVVKGVADIIGAFNTSFEKTKFGSLSNFISGVGKSAKIGLDEVAKVISGELSITDFSKEIVNIVNRSLVTMNDNFPKFFDIGAKAISQLADGLLSADSISRTMGNTIALIDTVLNTITEHSQDIINKGMEIALNISEGIDTNLPKVTESINKATNNIIEQLGDPKFQQDLENRAGEIIFHLVIGIVKALPNLIKAEINLIKTVKGTIDNLPIIFFNAGKEVINGFINGFVEKAKSVGPAIKKWADSVIKDAQKAFKIGSPSKRFRDEIGKWLPQGMEVGFEDELSNVYNDMQRAIDVEQSKLVASVETGRVFNTIQNSTPVAININGDVNMDGQKVGRLVTPTVTRTIKNGGGI